MIIYRLTWKLEGHNEQACLISEPRKAEKMKADLMSAAIILCAHFDMPPAIDKVEVQ